ncbi:MAG: hypothetical protein E7261_06090 [Lachnospiraceae bacterium]|nr:hypothetical protein [Lachnospiraceae bacterium]
MKKIVCFLIMFSMVFLVSCKEKTEFTGVAEGVRYSETYQICTATKEGVFYKGSNDMVHFRPVAAREDMILCYDPNCVHEPATDANPDPTCKGALFNGAYTNIAYYEGYIYYSVMDNVFEHDLYKMKVGGSGREYIATLPYRPDFLSGVVFYEDYMYYMVVENVRNEEKGKLEGTYYIVEFDLLNNDYRIVSDGFTDYLSGLQVTKDYVYLWMADASKNNGLFMKRVHKDTCEPEIFISVEDYKTHRSLAIYDDYYFYYDGHGEVGIKYFESGESEVLIDKDCSIIPDDSLGNGLFYRTVTDDGMTVTGGFFYDLITGETLDITEKTLELDIRSYDGYEGIFICGVLHSTFVVPEEEILATGKVVSE